MALSPPCVAVAGDEAVGGVAHEGGEEQAYSEELPRASEGCEGAQDGGGAVVGGVGLVGAFHPDHGVQLLEGFGRQELLGGFALEGCEEGGARALALHAAEERVGASVAEVACAVEEVDALALRGELCCLACHAVCASCLPWLPALRMVAWRRHLRSEEMTP